MDLLWTKLPNMAERVRISYKDMTFLIAYQMLAFNNTEAGNTGEYRKWL